MDAMTQLKNELAKTLELIQVSMRETSEKLVANPDRPDDVFVGRIGLMHEFYRAADDRGAHLDDHTLEIPELAAIAAAIRLAGSYIYTVNQHLGHLLTPTMDLIEGLATKVEHLVNDDRELTQRPF